MMIFSRWEVYCGYSLADLAKVRGILSFHQIPYRYKVMNHGGLNRGIPAARESTVNMSGSIRSLSESRISKKRSIGSIKNTINECGR